MARYQLEAPDGSIYELEAPEGTSETRLRYALLRHLSETEQPIEIEEAEEVEDLPLEDRPLIGDDRTALGRGFSRGIDVAGEAFGSALEGIGSSLGLEGLEEYGAEMAAENIAQLEEQERYATRLDDVEDVSSGLDFFLETLGETAPLTAASLAAGVAGALSAPAGAAAAVAGVGAAALSQLPFFYGFNRQRQKEAIDRGLRTEISEGAALLTAVPQATLDAIAERLLIGKFFTEKALRSGGIFTRGAKGIGTGIVSEVPTEVGQSVLERMQAGMDLLSDEALDEYEEVAIAAGLVGGTIGGTASALGKRYISDEERTRLQNLEIEGEVSQIQDELEQANEAGTLEENLATIGTAASTTQPVAATEPDLTGEGDTTIRKLSRLSMEEREPIARALGVEPIELVDIARNEPETVDQLVDLILAERDTAPAAPAAVDTVTEIDADAPATQPAPPAPTEVDTTAEVETAPAVTEEVVDTPTEVDTAPTVTEETTPTVTEEVVDTAPAVTEEVEDTTEAVPDEAAQFTTEPEVSPSAQTIRTLKRDALNSIGIKRGAAMRRRVRGEVTLEDLQSELRGYVANPQVRADRKQKVQDFLELPEEQQLEQMFEPLPVQLTDRQKLAQKELDEDRLREQRAEEQRVKYEKVAEGATTRARELELAGLDRRKKEVIAGSEYKVDTTSVDSGSPLGTATVPTNVKEAAKADRKSGPITSISKKILKEINRRIKVVERAKITYPEDSNDILINDKKVGTFKNVKRGEWVVKLNNEPESQTFPNKKAAQQYIKSGLEPKGRLREKLRASIITDTINEFDPAIKSIADTLDILPSVNPGIDTPLNPEIVSMLKEGRLADALLEIGNTNTIPRVAAIAKAFANLVGETRVVVVNDTPTGAVEKFFYSSLPLDAVGGYIPSMTETELKDRAARKGVKANVKAKDVTDVIMLREGDGLTTSTLIHEMTHALTIPALRNPNNPTTRKIKKIFEEAEPQLRGSQGANNIEEFVAEYFGSTPFRAELATINPNNSKVNILQRMYITIYNFIASKVPGMDTYKQTTEADQLSALKRLDNLDWAGDILAPAFEARGTGYLLSRSDGEGVVEVMKSVGAVQKEHFAAPPTRSFREKFKDNAKEFFGSSVSSNSKRITLGFFPSQALADSASPFNKHLEKLGLKLHSLMEEQRGKLATVEDEAKAVIVRVSKWAKQAGKEKEALLDEVINTSTVNAVDPSKSKKTYEQRDKQGRLTPESREKIAVWEKLTKRGGAWNRLGSDGQKIYIAMRDAYAVQYKRLQEVVLNRIDTLDMDAAAKAELKDTVAKRLLDRSIEPYFPLHRFGDYKLAFNALNPETNTKEPVFLMFETESERANYISQFLEKSDTVDRDNKGAPLYEEYDVDATPRRTIGATTGFMNEVLSILNKNQIDETIQNDIIKTFVNTLPESGYANSFQHREGRAGFIQNQIPVMRSKLYSISRNIVRMDYSRRLRDLATDIRGENPNLEGNASLRRAASRKGIVSDIQTEMLKRIDFAVNPPKGPLETFAQAANRSAFVFTIGLNASSALVNLSQIPLFVLPMLGGKYGFSNTTRSISSAAALVGSAVKGANSRLVRSPDGSYTESVFSLPSIDNFFVRDAAGNMVVRDDLDLPEAKVKELKELAPVVELAANRGQLNRTMISDNMGLQTVGPDKSIVDYAVSGSAIMFHQMEQFNRQVSILAAYKLELDKLSGGKASTIEQRKKAAQTALYEAQQLNGGSVLETAPRFAQTDIRRIAMMYKTYGIQMYYTMIKAFRQLLKGGPDPDAREIAFKQLLAVHGTALFFAGASGLPLFGAFTLIGDMFLRDDDEDDTETLVRKHIGEGWYKGAITSMFDVDVSQRIALTNLLFQANRYARNPSPEETVFYYLGGPAWSVGKSFYRGANEILEGGDMRRGIESMVPAFVRNGMRMQRYGEEGAQTRRRDPVFDDITNGQLAAQFFGFAPAEYARRQEENQALKRISDAIRKDRSMLLRKYYLAMRMGDYSEISKLSREIQDFNKRHFRNFPRAAISPDTIERSLRSHMRTTATMHNGITLSPMFRESLQAHVANSIPLLGYDD